MFTLLYAVVSALCHIKKIIVDHRDRLVRSVHVDLLVAHSYTYMYMYVGLLLIFVVDNVVGVSACSMTSV